MCSAVDGVSLCAQVREHVVAAARGALVAQRGDVHGRDDDALARPRTRFGQHAPVEVHDLTAARPRVGRVVFEARALIGRDDVGRVLDARGSG